MLISHSWMGLRIPENSIVSDEIQNLHLMSNGYIKIKLKESGIFLSTSTLNGYESFIKDN
jgi:hypothetical protein